MSEQRTFASVVYDTKRKVTSRERFLTEMDRVIRDVGGVICAAGPGLVPADRALYALRDITGTVASVPLIAS